LCEHCVVALTILIVPLLLFTQAVMTPVAAATPIVVVPISAATSVMTMPGLLLRIRRTNEFRDPTAPPFLKGGLRAQHLHACDGVYV
jgi:hypothetical protein